MTDPRNLLARSTASLFGQVFAVILVALAAAQAINVWVVVNLPAPVPEFYTATEIIQSLRGDSNITPRNGRPLRVKVYEVPPPVRPDDRRDFGRLRRDLADGASTDMDKITIYTRYGGREDRRFFRSVRNQMDREGQPREEGFLIAPFEVVMERSDGRWALVEPQRRQLIEPWQQRVMLGFALSAVFVAPLAYLFARRLSAPFVKFATAAERLGRDPQAPPLNLQGSAEIDAAVSAFNVMQDRLKRYVQDRTAMVGAVAHDLRTPLTRLRFRIESAPEELRAKMTEDVDQMDSMISDTLAFVRDEVSAAPRTRLELSSLLESVVDDLAETGAAVSIDSVERLVVHGDSLSLRRLLSNLLENAVKFGGAGRAKLYAADGHAVIEIDDDGPGVPEAELTRVFDPFYRREPSRNRETGGAGLGLAVVRSIARSHGGEVELTNRPEGGLKAQVRLPLS